MREIIPGLLWVGNAFDARDLKRVFDQGIQAFIDLAREESPVLPARELIYCRFPLVDGQGNSPAIIEAAISTAVRFITAKVPTLISCGGGMSRSPAIAAAVIVRVDAIEPAEAIKRVAAAGPHDVAPLLWSEVVQVLQGSAADRRQTTESCSLTAPKSDVA
ncbi:MAG TPA: dual specificity protein phosphatase [Pirellulales bacterium]|nr:dual specificity protein phosphatase [Pirellulales bacterium]